MNVLSEIEFCKTYQNQQINLEDTLILGDCFKILPLIRTSSKIKTIIIDPPYNISSKRIFTRKECDNLNLNFGKWDHFNEETESMDRIITIDDYINYYNIKKEKLSEMKLGELISEVNFLNWIFNLFNELYRVLDDNGSIFIFCPDKYISPLRIYGTFTLGMNYKHTIIWYKTNPPPRFLKNSLANANEFCCYFQKSSDSTFHFLGQKEMRSWFSGIVGGKERLKRWSRKNQKYVTLHPTQKPESLIRKLITMSSDEGDIIADFMGGSFTTPSVAKQENRKYFACEKNYVYFKYGKMRVEQSKTRKYYRQKIRQKEDKKQTQVSINQYLQK